MSEGTKHVGSCDGALSMEFPACLLSVVCSTWPPSAESRKRAPTDSWTDAVAVVKLKNLWKMSLEEQATRNLANLVYNPEWTLIAFFLAENCLNYNYQTGGCEHKFPLLLCPRPNLSWPASSMDLHLAPGPHSDGNPIWQKPPKCPRSIQRDKEISNFWMTQRKINQYTSIYLNITSKKNKTNNIITRPNTVTIVIAFFVEVSRVYHNMVPTVTGVWQPPTNVLPPFANVSIASPKPVWCMHGTFAYIYINRKNM